MCVCAGVIKIILCVAGNKPVLFAKIQPLKPKIKNPICLCFLYVVLFRFWRIYESTHKFKGIHFLQLLIVYMLNGSTIFLCNVVASITTLLTK